MFPFAKVGRNQFLAKGIEIYFEKKMKASYLIV